VSDDTFAKEIVQRADKLRSLRSPWLQIWQDCADFVLPRRSTRFETTQMEGQNLNERLYDGTAPWANEQLAAGLHSFATSPTKRWFKVRAKDQSLNEDDEVRAWLDDCSDRMYALFNNDKTQFNPQVHEMYLDLGALGTGVFFMEEVNDPRLPPMRFCTYHLGETLLQENQHGKIDTYFREFKMTARNAAAQFGQKTPAKIVKDLEKNPWAEHKFIHTIAPNDDFKQMLPSFGSNKPFVSVYVYAEEPATLRVGGFNRFPILAPRWSKVSGETYGRSPAMTCLPDIKMVNVMAKTIIIAAQKVVDPPLMLPDEGFMLPIKTSPGGLNYYDSSLNPDHKIVPLETRGRIDVGEKLIESRRAHIVRSFYIDMMQLQEGPQMTATEVVQRNEDKMRLMAPMIGRVQSEFLNELIEYTFHVMYSRGLFREIPRQLRAAELEIDYVSPVARAQKMSQLFGFQRMMETLTMVAQVKPAVMDRINEDQVPVLYGDLLDVPTKLLRSDKEVAKIRQDQAEAAQAQQEAALLEQTAGAAADVAKADPSVGSKMVGGSGRPPMRAVK
jgi:Bacteriophage head to tail connecting protein